MQCCGKRSDDPSHACFVIRLWDAIARALGVRRASQRPPARREEERQSQGAVSQRGAGFSKPRRISVPKDPAEVLGQLTLLEAQAKKLRATIDRRKRLQGDSKSIVGHYEEVLAGIEDEIACLSKVAAGIKET